MKSDIEKIILNLGKRSPFYLYLLLNISRVPSKEVRNIELSFQKGSKITLYYNPEWINSKHPEFVEGLILHHLMHLINLHFLIKPKDNRDRMIWDLAMDAAINQYIPQLSAFGVPLNLLIEEGHGVDNEKLFVLPPDWMPDRSAEEYHKWILQKMDELGRYDIAVVAQARENSSDSHDGMYRVQDIDMILELTKSDLKKVFNLYGSELESGVKRLVELSISRPLLNWKDKIRHFAGVSEYGERYTTVLRPNRRYEQQPGWKTSHMARLGIVVDTSGSIIEEEFDDFFSEIEALSRYVDTNFVLVQVDRAVNLEIRYSKGAYRNMEIIGGGETDLQPAIDHLQDNHHPEGIIVFTDGYTDLPVVKRRVLFVLSKHYSEEFLSQARKIYGSSSVVVLR
ncbi:MAG TPA: VWA-like domain-containing protein [Pseudothermotoga sp.]|nr:VWA-like domain-containing protein [Pseudothermotoga sp.]HOK84457.1 VWA-like domain-containing protein [Pseudothermotoga sp.]HPP70941.1 VWA-like domain-containing protein [Pseudothermotoga sp.]